MGMGAVQWSLYPPFPFLATPFLHPFLLTSYSKIRDFLGLFGKPHSEALVQPPLQALQPLCRSPFFLKEALGAL